MGLITYFFIATTVCFCAVWRIGLCKTQYYKQLSSQQAKDLEEFHEKLNALNQLKKTIYECNEILEDLPKPPPISERRQAEIYDKILYIKRFLQQLYISFEYPKLPVQMSSVARIEMMALISDHPDFNNLGGH